MTTPLRVILADDHEIFRDGFVSLIQKKANDQIQIVGQASNGKELVQLAGIVQPDVVITDIQMPQMDGVQAAQLLHQRYPSLGIIALSTFDTPSIIFDMLEAGARGYLLKNASKEEIIEAVQLVGKGQTYYSNSTSNHLLKLIAASKHNPFSKKKLLFTEGEHAIIRLICKQCSNKEIADRLYLSTRTIEDHIRRIKDKTEAKNLVGIALFAIKNELMQLEEV